MSAVDVLAVMDAAGIALQAESVTKCLELLDARDAVAELMREVDIVADALAQDGRGPAGMTKGNAAKRLTAALARCGK